MYIDQAVTGPSFAGHFVPPGPASVGYRAFGRSRKLMEVVGSRTSDNPAALDQQKNDDTSSKLPLNSVKNDAADPLLPALSRPGQKTSPRENLGIRAMCDMGVLVRCDLLLGILTVTS